MSDYEHYLGNPLLKKSNVAVEWNEEQILEYQKCMQDPLYFIQNYIKIVSLDEGLVPFSMFPFQKDMVGTIHNNRFTICRMPRQSGKSTTMVSYILHYVLFNPSMNVAILANKASTARDILGRLQLAYENLPKWLQQGVMSWNKGSLELENYIFQCSSWWFVQHDLPRRICIRSNKRSRGLLQFCVSYNFIW